MNIVRKDYLRIIERKSIYLYVCIVSTTHKHKINWIAYEFIAFEPHIDVNNQ